MLHVQPHIECVLNGGEMGHLWGTGIALHKRARLHEAGGDKDAAAHYHHQNLQRIDAEGLQGSDALEGLLFLATWHKVHMSRVMMLWWCACHATPSQATVLSRRCIHLLLEVQDLPAQGLHANKVQCQLQQSDEVPTIRTRQWAVRNDCAHDPAGSARHVA